MKVEKFKVIQNRIRLNSFDILELNYEANSAVDIKSKNRLLNTALAKLKIIDFLLNLSLDKKLITQKKYHKIAEKIDDILRYETGWIKQINSNSDT